MLVEGKEAAPFLVGLNLDAHLRHLHKVIGNIAEGLVLDQALLQRLDRIIVFQLVVAGCLVVVWQQHARLDLDQRRRHLEEFAGLLQVAEFHQTQIVNVLLRQHEDVDREDVDLVNADQMQKQVERSFELLGFDKVIGAQEKQPPGLRLAPLACIRSSGLLTSWTIVSKAGYTAQTPGWPSRMHGFLRNLTASFSHPTHPRFLELLRALREAGDAFGTTGPGSASWGLASDYQAIETFRQEPGQGFSSGDGGGVVRSFRSSGTTASERAASYFSAVGLSFYQLGSLIAFFSMIQKVFATDQPCDVPGVSLVPRVEEWPESSLAQMVAWIAQHAPVEYRSDCGDAAGPPRWVFGTAFHFVNLIDAGKAQKLPPGSVIIETGGTKGRSRAIDRDEFYVELTRAFGVPRARIVSEYGMCELAAQAYDIAGNGFRFPFWVTPAIVTAPVTVGRRGEGLLLIADPLRVDYARAIRSEDLARVGVDRSFVLLGRAPQAPLKGCSLLAEEIVAAEPKAHLPGGLVQLFTPDMTRVETAHKTLFQFLTDGDVHAALADDFGGEPLAKAALEDLAQSVPQTTELWEKAARQAFEGERLPQRWLFVLPANHPLVGVYPLAIGAALGLDMTVRVPAALAGKERFLQRLIDAFSARSCSAALRIESAASVANYDALLVYGDDETIEKIRTVSDGKPLSAFGTRAGISVIDSDRPEPKIVKALARDAFSLGQSGCMSVRLAIVLGDGARARDFCEALRKAGEDFLHATTIPPLDRIGQELEATRLAALGFTNLPVKGLRAPLIAFRRGGPEPTQALALRPYTLPVWFADSLPQALIEDSTIGTITASPPLFDELSCSQQFKNHSVGKSFRLLGRANAPAWNGLHEGRPLFRIN